MAQRGPCTTSTSTMPAAIETRARRLRLLGATRTPGAGPEARTIELRTQPRPGGWRPDQARCLARQRSVNHQSLSCSLAGWSMRPWESALVAVAGHGFSRSHGPSEERVKDLEVNVSLLFDRMADRPPLPGLPIGLIRPFPARAMRGRSDRLCPAVPVRRRSEEPSAAGRRSPRSGARLPARRVTGTTVTAPSRSCRCRNGPGARGPAW